MFRFALLFALSLSVAAPAAGRPVDEAGGLPLPVARALRAAGIAPGQVGLAVHALDGQVPLLAHRADVPMNPASSMKLLTTHAALSLLGPDYRWRTELASRADPAQGHLAGDLLLRGGGDPKLVAEDIAAMLVRLREAGVDHVAGDLLIDDSLYALPRDEPAFDGDPLQPYNVKPSAALLNFKAVRLSVTPDETGGAARVVLEPPLRLRIDNAVEAVPGPCRHPLAQLSVQSSPDEDALRLAGRWSPACGEQAMNVALLDHRRFIGALFGALWTQAGGTWSGRARWATDIDREGARTLVAWTSPRTLADVVRDVNKFSNNVMARQLLLQMGLHEARAATPESGARRVRQWLAERGLALPGLVLENGSGLSRRERLSAADLVALLRDAAPGDALRDSLPVAGVDGTMKRRLQDEAVTGRAWIKTGSLSDVRSAAGYVDTASGRRVALAVMVNGQRAEAAPAVIDTLIRWVHTAY